MVERGGLDYTIRARDEFSDTFSRFRRETREAQRAWREYRNTVQGTVQAQRDLVNQQKQFARSSAQLANTTRRVADSQRRSATEQARSARSIRDLVREERRRLGIQNRTIAAQRTVIRQGKEGNLGLSQRVRLQRELLRTESQLARQEALASSKRLRDLRVRLEVQRRLNREKEKELINEQLARAGIGQRTAARARGTEDPEAAARRRLTGRLREQEIADIERRLIQTDAAFARLRRSGDATERTFNRVAFTFRRLFGILAAFTIARNVVRGFGLLITNSIRWNAEIENAELGYAAIVASAAEVRNIQGELVQGAEAFAIAQQEAARQTALIRRDALLTAATAPQLIRAFQEGLAPGLQAGLGLDQIRLVARRISQAAAALGLPQNQLAEELRSLLAGTITPRTTRIATALGITNEDIRNAKEAGELFEFLEERLKGFASAEEAALSSFTVRLANARAALAEVVRIGAVPFFEDLSQTFQDVRDAAIDTSIEDAIGIRPEQVAIARQFFRILQSGLAELRAIGTGVGAAGIAQVLGGIADAFGLIFSVVRVAVTGLLNGLRPVAVLWSTILSTVRALASVLSAITGGLLGTFTQALLAAALAARLMTASLTAALGLLAGSTGQATLLAFQLNLAAVAGVRLAAAVGTVLRLLRGAAAFLGPLAAAVAFIDVLSGGAVSGFLAGDGGASDIAAELDATLKSVDGSVQGLAAGGAAFADALERAAKAAAEIESDLAIETALFGTPTLIRDLQRDLLGFRFDSSTIEQDFTNKILEAERALQGVQQRAVQGFGLADAIDADIGRVEERIQDLQDELSRNLRQLEAEGRSFINTLFTPEGAPAGENLVRVNEAIEDEINLLKQLVDATLRVQAAENALAEQRRADEEILTRRRALFLLQESVGAQERELQQGVDVTNARALNNALRQSNEFLIENARLQAEIESTLANQFRIREEIRVLEEEILAVRENEGLTQEQRVAAEEAGRQAIAERLRLLGLEEERIREILALQEQRDPSTGAQLAQVGGLFGSQLAENQSRFGEQLAGTLFDAVEGFSSLLSSSLVAIFDPNQNVDLMQAFGKFALGLAQQILDIVIRRLIIGALGSILGGGAGVGGGLGSFVGGFHEGGSVPDGRRGKRPRGVHRKDTVRAYLEPKEFVEPVSSVSHYGEQIFEALRRKLIPKSAVRSLMAGIRVGTARKPRIASLQSGGTVPARGAGAPGSGDVLGRSYMVANDEAARLLLTGGRHGFLDVIEANATEIKSRLNLQTR